MRYSTIRTAARLGCAVLSLLLGGCQATLFTAINASARDTTVRADTDIVFDRERKLKLDVYALPGAHQAPVVIFFYGGSWNSGKRQWYRWLGERFAQHGWVVVIPDYRKYPQVDMDGFMRDASHAVAWAREHAARYGGDGEHLFLMGHSAGAHIAALLATDGHWLRAVGMRPDQLDGFIGLAGPYDFLPLKKAMFREIFGHSHVRQIKSQPVHFVDGDEPPMLLLQGKADRTVYPRNARSLADAMRAAGEPVQLRMYPDVGHVGLLLSLSRAFAYKAPSLQAIVNFIQMRSNHDQ
ncbi:MAG: alpha/beta hydrolase [Rhodanobacteraceae bacterium]